MGHSSFRSLLFAAILISNCITWTASRHHYTHNVNGHRSRHRRQGAGLFLPTSYIIPGGEGSGAWGDWGEISECSRTCGGGVASQKRICLEIGPDGQPLCSGGDTKYFSCRTEDCPEGSVDFRAAQCSEYDSKLFSGIQYQWEPITKGLNPCELNCSPRGERVHYRHKAKVIDGTRCTEDSFDVCVDGVCQPVGCDMMLGSNAREDKCRECGGNGTSCYVVESTVSAVGLTAGYNDVLLIPEGATSIKISQVDLSENFLALRARNSKKYYLNGNYRIEQPKSFMIGDSLWQYERYSQDFKSQDSLRSLGPTTEPLYVSLIVKNPEGEVKYEFSIPNTSAPPPGTLYVWSHRAFSPCSATCGGGVQTREVPCVSRDTLEQVDESLCEESTKPATNQICGTQECPAQWVEGSWSPCSKPCGEGGTRTRQVQCEKITSNGDSFRHRTLVGEQECFELHGRKPAVYQECNQDSRCPTWFTGPWKQCDKLCGEGKQTRMVVCYQRTEGRVEVFSDDACSDEKPPTEQPCILHPCAGVDWVLSDWSGCDSCLSTVRTREALCVTEDREIVNSSFCSYHPVPILEEPCDKTKLPPCTVQWYATQWSNCSVECGKGVKTRRIFCGLFDGASVIKVDDSRCDAEDKYTDSTPCEIPDEKCPAKWFGGPWSECTKKCGRGEQFRKVVCLSGGKESRSCSEASIIDDTQSCNEGPCDKDEMLPLDSKSTPIMDDSDEEDCIDEDDYPDVGAEESNDEKLAAFTDTTFASDSTSEYTTESGSGSEPTVDFTEFESSGSEFTEFTDETTESDITRSIETEGTGSTDTEETETDNTGSTESEATEPTVTEDTASTETELTESTVTEETSSTETGLTDSTLSTETGETSESGGTDPSSSVNTESTSEISIGSTISEATSEYSPTDTEFTTESGETDTVASDNTENTSESNTASTESEATSDSSTTDETTESGSTASEDTASTQTDVTGSTVTEDTASTEETGSTVTEETSSTETEETDSTVTEETGSTVTEETESNVTEETGSTVTEETGSTEPDLTGSTESTETENTLSTGSDLTTESGVTDTSVSENTESTSEFSTESTVSEPTSESGATELSSSEGSTESTVTELTESTTEGTTEAEDTSTWDWTSTVDVFTSKLKCKARKKTSKCAKTKFGCCPDRRTAAAGPFDGGCPKPVTCKESDFGCCPDGVSPATGPKEEGCPTPPCNETLYGCCKSDNFTASEGNDQEGCPPPPPACLASKYGCCKDNKTEAKGPKKKGCPETAPKPKHLKTCADTEYGCCFDKKTAASGPDGQGCPCDITEFGCCPDGVSPAGGAQMEGCVVSCHTSTYGCCEGTETPAHGPNQEGCCLLTAYGCCPDNLKPAEGPHLEGCGCEHTQFGCCPDGVSIASGSNNRGCGCQYTEHGCCPDKHTEASGPDFEGCGCYSYQFGCCPDGVTKAQGPRNQGCYCQQTEFGCCGDEKTAASGPDKAGCDCSNSKYGCCPDGRTEATGPKFQGCTDIIENKQAYCHLPSDGGSCRNFTLTWYYNMEYGGCSRFWYGGCDGNGNRFQSKEDCEDVCVNPSPKDVCKLPKVKSACKEHRLRWYYDSEVEQCMQFVHGGCALGNANNFESRELCMKQCEPPREEDTCKLPIERGSCAGNFGRWGFNPETGSCEQFIWGGCEGNTNRFDSETACLYRCNPPGKPKPICSEPVEAGNCSDTKLATWAFSQTENRCVPFYYTGCGGNGNRFDALQACTETCPSAYVPEQCALPSSVGDCDDYRERYYYDTAIKRCRPFYYGGCGGNSNNFVTEAECERRCHEEAITTTQRPQTQAQPQQPPTDGRTRPQPPLTQEQLCALEIDPGPCTNLKPRFAYDASSNQCKQFQYGGCGGNHNNFPTKEYCEGYCVREQAQNPCTLPSAVGDCYNYTLKYFYDSSERSCRQFYYGGCGGNGNNFDTEAECQRNCQEAPVTTTRRPQAPPQDQDLCTLPYEPGDCDDYVIRYFYNSTSQSCSDFYWGGCGGNQNNFQTAEECESRCHTAVTTTLAPLPQTRPQPQDLCQLSYEPGNCLEYQYMWYYDAANDTCAQFIYGGCDGNDNRFATQESCEARCRPRAPVLTTTTVLYPEEPEECRDPPSLSPCGEPRETFYFSASLGECVSGEFGNCAGANQHSSVEQCERRCGRFQGVDVCRYPLDPGPCRASFPKFYFDQATRSCLSFTYGGCEGGPNRFSTIEECENYCGASPPPSAPEPNTQTEPEVNAVIGGRVTLRCLFHGNPPPKITWRREEITIDSDIGRYRLHSDGALEIVSLYRNDSGVYICIAENELGTSSQEVVLNVKEDTGHCASYIEECSQIRCEYSVQRTHTPEGCERCACVTPVVDCEPLRQECRQLKCHYGLRNTTDADGCTRCSCVVAPCANRQCAEGERCIPIPYEDPVAKEVRYTTDCRIINKEGVCPSSWDAGRAQGCRRECIDDADCVGAGKCCARGCSQLCLVPAPLGTSPLPILPRAPEVNSQTEPEVNSEEGGKATLRCLFHGNPPPKITWRRKEITIDGNVGRYRLLSDGALEIVSLYRNDSGVYICIADNDLGSARQEILLNVNDPVTGPARISGDDNAVETGTLGEPFSIRCLAYGSPEPSVSWHRRATGYMVPYSSPMYEARGSVLQIRELNYDTIGEYTCQAFNGVSKPASWNIVVKAYRPTGSYEQNEFLVDRDQIVVVTPRVQTTEQATTPPPEIQVPVYTVPVSTSIDTDVPPTVATGSDLSIACNVDGYPYPEVYWTKNKARVGNTDRIRVTDSRLTISSLTLEDSGDYECHASNQYGSHYSSVRVNVQGLYIPPECTDNPFFANCHLIVRSKFCNHNYYSKFCCRSCVEAGQLNPQVVNTQW